MPIHAPQHLFVYGTLMRGFNNPFSRELATRSTYLGEGYFPGRLYLVAWYPGALYLPESSSRVHGEIYTLTDPGPLLTLLDEYEDLHEDPALSLYLRKKIPVRKMNAGYVNCWTYIYNQTTEPLTEIPDGRFRHSS